MSRSARHAEAAEHVEHVVSCRDVTSQVEFVFFTAEVSSTVDRGRIQAASFATPFRLWNVDVSIFCKREIICRPTSAFATMLNLAVENAGHCRSWSSVAVLIIMGVFRGGPPPNRKFFGSV